MRDCGWAGSCRRGSRSYRHFTLATVGPFGCFHLEDNDEGKPLDPGAVNLDVHTQLPGFRARV